MLYQMIAPIAMNKEKFNEFMRYKFCITEDLFAGIYPNMLVPELQNDVWYSMGNLILKEV